MNTEQTTAGQVRSRRTMSANCVATRPAVGDNTDLRVLLTLLIFNSATGTRSSRKIMARCEQDVRVA